MSIGSQLRGATFSSGAGSTNGDIGGEESLIDRSSAFDGVLRTARSLRVEGQAKGEVYCDGTLFVEEGGQVDARIVSANITVAGLLSGEVTCHGKLHIMPTGRVSGRVATSSLVIQEGAIYEGELRMSNIDEEPGVPETTAPARPDDRDDEID